MAPVLHFILLRDRRSLAVLSCTSSLLQTAHDCCPKLAMGYTTTKKEKKTCSWLFETAKMGRLFFTRNTFNSRSKHTKGSTEHYLLGQITGSTDSERFIRSGWGSECYLSDVETNKQNGCGKTLTWTAWRGRAESLGRFYGSRAPATTTSAALCCRRWSAQRKQLFLLQRQSTGRV